MPVHHLDLDEPLEQPPPLGRGGSRIGCRSRSHRRGSEDRRQQGDQDAPHWAIKIEGAAGQMQKVGIDNIDTGDALGGRGRGSARGPFVPSGGWKNQT